jgi:hypothetical protein
LFEAARDSQYAELYAEIAGEGLTGTSDFEEARADLEGVMLKLELSSIEAQYRQLLSQTAMSEAERRHLQTLSQRLAELKGAARVGMVPPP